VIGCRDIAGISHFSWIKKILQKVGSCIVGRFAKAKVADTTSGFRAYSREAALRLNIFSTYTYTLETIIQAGRKEIPISCVNISTNEKLRESRLINNIADYIARSVITILRIFLMYEPLKTFLGIAAGFMLPSFILIARFFYFYFTEGRSGHIQSLVIAAILAIAGFGAVMLGLLGDIIARNRALNEEILYRLRKQSLE
jgi:hypothetical protein